LGYKKLDTVVEPNYIQTLDGKKAVLKWAGKNVVSSGIKQWFTNHTALVFSADHRVKQSVAATE
jgi:hypothetical protein